MNYNQAVEYIHSRLKFGIKPGLERINALCEFLGNPQDKLKIIHVAGTNGKGSVCAMLSAIFKNKGLKTGLFISPYIIEFCERFQINGQFIPKDDLAKIITQIKPFADKIEDITEFEIITAAAFKYFADSKCDIVILEVGLGGKYDSTNIVKSPLCSVIGKIALDHTAILGDTIEKIAAEKCGIIKQGCNTVCYPGQPSNALAVILESTAKKQSHLHIPNLNSVKIIEHSIYGSVIEYGGMRLNIPFAGDHQIANALTAVKTASLCGASDSEIENGIKNAVMPARIQVISNSPLVVVDGSHNPDGVTVLADLLKKYLTDKNLIFIMGMLGDKSVDEALSIIAPLAYKIYAVTPDNPRAMKSDDFAQLAKKWCGDISAENSIFDACKKAVEQCRNTENSAVICCGSLYLAADILKEMKKILP